MPGFALLVSLIIVLGTAAFSPAAKETRPDRPSVLSTDSRLAPGFVTVDQQLLEASDNFSAAPIDTYAENVDIVRFISGDAEQIGAPPPRAVAFRQQSLWEEYRWYILAAVLIVFLQTLVIVDILVERRQRLRIQAELGESHRIIELAASAGELGLWARDLGSGAIWANSTLRSMFNWHKHQNMTMSDVLGYVHPGDRSRLLDAMQRSETGDLPVESEFRVILPDSTVRWMFVKGRRVDTPKHQGRRRMGVILDITERKHAEEALRESEERFRTLADTAPVMIWMAGTDKVCTFFNKGWLAFTGRTLEQEVGNGWTQGVHEEDIGRCVKIYTEAFETRSRFTIDYRQRRFDGEYRWILHNGAPRFGADGSFLGYIGSAIDVTERKRNAEELEKERLYLRQVLDVDPNFIFAKDRQGRYTLANQAIADAYGTTVENLIGKTDGDFDPNPEEVESFRRVDLEVMNTLEERFIPEEHFTDVRGNVRWFQTVKRPIIANDGSANQVLAAATDITVRKVTEAQLREQRAELAHVARISNMGELAASLAHELNQPLTAILSNAQAAVRFIDGKPPYLEEVRQILQDIVKDNCRAADVIRRMRALVKKEPLDFATLDLGNVIRDVVALVHSDAILQNIEISLEVDENLPPVVGDRVQLQQVALNLLLNAFDAMSDSRVAGRKILIKANLDDDCRNVKVAVRDGGIGLTADNFGKLFQPFYTTKRDGLGMGLSICWSILDAHRGYLWAENNSDGCGATFSFTIPVEERYADR